MFYFWGFDLILVVCLFSRIEDNRRQKEEKQEKDRLGRKKKADLELQAQRTTYETREAQNKHHPMGISSNPGHIQRLKSEFWDVVQENETLKQQMLLCSNTLEGIL